MVTNPEILEKVKTFGAFQYDVYKIITLLNILPEQRADFVIEFEDKTSTLRRYYEQGVAIGEHNLSVALRKRAEDGDVFANQQLEDFMGKKKVESLRKELFGV